MDIFYIGLTRIEVSNLVGHWLTIIVMLGVCYHGASMMVRVQLSLIDARSYLLQVLIPMLGRDMNHLNDQSGSGTVRPLTK